MLLLYVNSFVYHGIQCHIVSLHVYNVSAIIYNLSLLMTQILQQKNVHVCVQRVQLEPLILHPEKLPWVATFAALRLEKMQLRKNVLAAHTATKIALATAKISLKFFFETLYIKKIMNASDETNMSGQPLIPSPTPRF